MNKLVVVFLVALLSCAFALKAEHEQKYAPSTPGGNYLNVNGTQPTSPSSNTGNPQALINGQPYYYNGPFTLACWLPTNTQTPYRYNTCFSAQGCYNLLTDYQNCRGTVKKYPPVTTYPSGSYV